jgi:hypothetical protein
VREVKDACFFMSWNAFEVEVKVDFEVEVLLMLWSMLQ